MTLADDLAVRDQWVRDGKRVAAATVISVQGSAPRPPGTRMLVSSDGDIVGSVSAGCVDPAVVERSVPVIETGEPEVLAVGISDEDAFAAGLACGGTIEVLVEPW